LRRQAAAFFHAGNYRRASATRRGQTPPPRTAVWRRFAGCLTSWASASRIVRALYQNNQDGRRTGDGAELAIIELVDNAREKEAQASARKRVKGSTKKKADETKATETAADKADKKEEVETRNKKTLWVAPIG